MRKRAGEERGDHGTWGRNDEEGQGATEREQEQKRYMTGLMEIRESAERRQAWGSVLRRGSTQLQARKGA